MRAEPREAVGEFAESVGPAGPVVAVGGRTQWAVGGAPDPAAREVRAPAGVFEFEPAEMTVTCGAATMLADLQATLGASGQRVALPDRPGATVGGILAVGESGIRRLGDGHIRDAVLQVVYVDADGVVVRNGGPTVKNVSGFDLCKLMVGSLGTLGLLAEVTLRCVPLPPASRWFTSDADPFAAFARLYRPTAFLWNGSMSWVLLEGTSADVAAQATAAGLVEADGPPPMPSGGRESVRPGELADLEGQFVAEVGVGVVHRPHPVSASPPPSGAADLCREIKRRFDPAGRLNPGRSVLP